MQCEKDKFYAVNRYLSSSFRHLGRLIGRHPLYFVIIPFVFTTLSALGLFRLKVVKDTEFLYVPSNGRTLKVRSEIEKFFPENATDFDFTRMIRYYGANMIIATCKDGGTMMREDVFDELQMLNEKILDIKITWKGQNVTYSDICMRSEGECYRNNILSLKTKFEDVRRKKVKIKYPMEINSSHINVDAINLGGVSTDENSFVLDFQAVRLLYFVDYHNSSKREMADKWDKEFLKIVSQSSFVYIRVSVMSGINIDNELTNVFVNIVWYMIISGACMITFASVTCLAMDWVRSKPLIGVSGCMSSFFAVVTAFGILLLFGMKYTETNLVIPFIVVGIGLDDSFVLLAAWRKTNPKDSVEKRMSETFSEATISITITSLTNVACSLIAITTPFGILQIAGSYMAVSIFIDYIYQVTFFGGFLALDGYREAKSLHAILFVPVKLDERPSGLLRFIKYGCYSSDGNEDKTTMKCYKNHLGKLLTFSIVKAAIIIFFLLYLAGGIYFTKYVQPMTGINRVFNDNSYMLNFFRDENTFFSHYPDRIQIIVTSSLDYSDSNIQNNIEKLTTELENSPHVAGSNLTESWLRLYLKFIKNPQFWLSLRGYNLSRPEDFTDALRRVFLKFKWAKHFNKDIVFSDDGDKILASRFFIQTKLVDDSLKENEVFINLWNIIDKYNLPVQCYNYRYIFFDVIFEAIPTATQSIVVSSCVVILIFIILIPNLFCAFCIALTIACIEVITIGYMSVWDVTFYPIVTVFLIVITGFCTDYAAHISYAYAKSKGKNPNEKLRDCLDVAGHAIVQGCLSSLFGVVVLIAAPYTFFKDMFKVFIIFIISSIIQGLFILPVMLSLWDSFLLLLCKSDDRKRLDAEFADLPNTNEVLLK
ncbi:patched domain-containing protein 3-like [Centruroides sculpturatus]|uniref:patched domain-containing protein 3-like n=1 Tax=Centruroides sculpturatus TaxID=218467 RepID=UPI000C6D4186|nr:patched domain-containing protein 3-like [Centruroides sculpturatus]XP_023234998.1 patched domain-containing protein 3-like [Centruroides sculpturatus]